MPLLCSSTPLFPTPPLVSRKYPHVPLGVGGWSLGYTKSEGVGLIVRAISFPDFQPIWSWSTNVTDRRTYGHTDRQTDDMRWHDRALHYSASRGKNSEPRVYHKAMHVWRIRTIHQTSRLPDTLSPLSGKRSMPFAIITASCLSLATFTASAITTNNVTSLIYTVQSQSQWDRYA